MTVKIMSAYIADNQRVVVITRGDSFIYPKKLWGDNNKKLLDQVITRGEIDTNRWEKI